MAHLEQLLVLVTLALLVSSSKFLLPSDKVPAMAERDFEINRDSASWWISTGTQTSPIPFLRSKMSLIPATMQLQNLIGAYEVVSKRG